MTYKIGIGLKFERYEWTKFIGRLQTRNMCVGISFNDNDNSCYYVRVCARKRQLAEESLILHGSKLLLHIICDIIIIIINCIRNRWMWARFWTFHFCISHVCLFKIWYVIIIIYYTPRTHYFIIIHLYIRLCVSIFCIVLFVLYGLISLLLF